MNCRPWWLMNAGCSVQLIRQSPFAFAFTFTFIFTFTFTFTFTSTSTSTSASASASASASGLRGVTTAGQDKHTSIGARRTLSRGLWLQQKLEQRWEVSEVRLCMSVPEEHESEKPQRLGDQRNQQPQSVQQFVFFKELSH